MKRSKKDTVVWIASAIVATTGMGAIRLSGFIIHKAVTVFIGML